MSLTNLQSVEDFQKYVKSKELSVVHFYGEWADQCRQINGVLEEMTKSGDYKGVQFAKIAAESVPCISSKYRIKAVPTVLLIRSGSVADRVDGAKPGELAKKIKEELTTGSSHPIETLHYHPSVDVVPIDIRMPKKSLDEKLKKLINKAPCMLFMKGDRANPRCGFSKNIVKLLDSYNTDYQTYDILLDDVAREGLKVYSKWPTYPQLYLHGELLGGFDIVKDMSDKGQLEGMLPKKKN